MKVKMNQQDHKKMLDAEYNRGWNDAIDTLQAQRSRKKPVGELWRVARLLDYFSDKGRRGC